MRFVARLRRSNSYCYVYAVKTDRMENDFSLQKEEVSAVRLVLAPAADANGRRGQHV